MSNATFILPAGRWWIGDPCYPFPNDGPKSDEWERVLEATDFFERPHCDLGEIQVWAGSTTYGDGTYLGTDGNSYPVDAGMLGIMPVSTVDYLGNDKAWLSQCGKFMEFPIPFRVEVNNGGFMFGSLFIETGNEDEDYEG
jgi:hypothetical protein